MKRMALILGVVAAFGVAPSVAAGGTSSTLVARQAVQPQVSRSQVVRSEVVRQVRPAAARTAVVRQGLVRSQRSSPLGRAQLAKLLR